MGRTRFGAGFALLLALSVGCSKKDAGGGGKGSTTSIAGSWVLDPEKSLRAVLDSDAWKRDVEGLAGEELEARKKVVRDQLAEFHAHFDVRADGTFTGETSMGADAQSQEGIWTPKGAAFLFTPQKIDNKPVEGEDAKPETLEFVDGVLVLRPENGNPIVFSRAPK